MKPLSELKKPSIIGGDSLFSEVNIMIADADHRLAVMAKKVLFTLACKNIFIVHTGKEALALMKEEQIDFIITEWDMEEMDGIEMTRYLRQSLESPNRMIPIVMLTARHDLANIRTARDSGVTEYLIKPFAAKTLLERVHEIVENPRSFVLCKNYIGPDRRRTSSPNLPSDAAAGRVYIKRKPALRVSRDELKQIILDDTPRIILPNYDLKKKLGLEVPPEPPLEAQSVQQQAEVVDHAFKQFMQYINTDMGTMEASYKELGQNPDDFTKYTAQISEAARSIQSRAGMFGFARASEVADLISIFCDKHYDPENKLHLFVIEKHIQTIHAIFTRDIIGEGGAVGDALLQDLRKLTAKCLENKLKSAN